MSPISSSSFAKAGNLKLFKENWSDLTSDPWILDTISGYKIDFVSSPVQYNQSPKIKFSVEDERAIDEEISQLLTKRAIREIQFSDCKFISSIFTISKKTGGLRPIINLKSLNKFVKYEHFKMESFKLVKDMVMHSDLLTSIDLKDAYFSIPIHQSQHCYLAFQWKERYFCFECLPFGLSSAPRTFTKVMKPVIAAIRSRGIRAIIYLDDILLFAQTKQESLSNTSFVLNLLASLGFSVNSAKSCLEPKYTCTYLGFHIDTQKMVFSLPPSKIDKLQGLGSSILSCQNVSIRQFAKFIGLIISTFDIFPQGKLHFRSLEIQKTNALRKAGGNFDAPFVLDASSRSEIQWWLLLRAEEFSTSIKIPPISITISTDASRVGWGAICDTDNSFAQDTWSSDYVNLHINELELRAIQNALLTLCGTLHNAHVHVKSDNSTSVAYINKMGGNTPALDSVTKEIWAWCLDANIWISASHIAGVDNVQADRLSRRDMNKELQLSPIVFCNIVTKLREYVRPDIDLFASKFNHQLPFYVSWSRDPCAFAIDAFSLSWDNIIPFIFPPFCLISRILDKIRADRTERALLIAPIWRAQPWFPMILDLLIAPPLLLPADCILPHTQPPGKLDLVAWVISTSSYARQDYLNTLPISSHTPGDLGLISNTSLFGISGIIGVSNSRLIRISRL